VSLTKKDVAQSAAFCAQLQQLSQKLRNLRSETGAASGDLSLLLAYIVDVGELAPLRKTLYRIEQDLDTLLDALAVAIGLSGYGYSLPELSAEQLSTARRGAAVVGKISELIPKTTSEPEAPKTTENPVSIKQLQQLVNKNSDNKPAENAKPVGKTLDQIKDLLDKAKRNRDAKKGKKQTDTPPTNDSAEPPDAQNN
jgi:hypothetical protein